MTVLRGSAHDLVGVSLFSNCGAGDVGYRRSGFTFDVMAEIDPRRLAIAVANHADAVGIEGDLRLTWSNVVEAYRERRGRKRPDLLSACPPCQGLSSAQSERGEADDADAGSRDPRNLLVTPIIKVARELRPRVIVVENVLAFLSRKVRHPRTRASVSAAHVLVSELANLYRTFPLLTDLADYGVPQTRRRAFLTFVARDVGLLSVMHRHRRTPYPRPTHSGEGEHITLREALARFELDSLDARDRESAHSDRALHKVPVWDERRYAMVAAIPANSGASAWENDRCPGCRRIERRRDRATCSRCGTVLRRPVLVARNGRPRLINGFHMSSYRRMDPDRPAATVTTASGHMGSDLTLHPSENRVLSPLECASLQTLPRSFRWENALEDWGHTTVRAMIGEAVPPRFTELHGRRLAGLLERREWRALLQADDVRAARGRLHLQKGASSE